MGNYFTLENVKTNQKSHKNVRGGGIRGLGPVGESHPKWSKFGTVVHLGSKNRKQILLRSPTNNCAKYQHPKKDEIFLKNNKIVFFTFLKVYKNEPFKEIFFSFVKTKKFAKPFVHMVEGRIFKAKKLVENLVTLSLYISDTFKCTQLEI